MAYWTAARFQPQRERLALHCLALRGFECYAPRIRLPKPRHVHRSFFQAGSPPPLLFPGYVFIVIELQWHQAHHCPGCIGLIMDGIQPARVPDGVIEEIRGRERGGLISLPKAPSGSTDPKPGDRVRVRSGPLTGLYGIHVGMKPHERIAVLLQLLGGQLKSSWLAAMWPGFDWRRSFRARLLPQRFPSSVLGKQHRQKLPSLLTFRALGRPGARNLLHCSAPSVGDAGPERQITSVLQSVLSLFHRSHSTSL
jgi:transcriptional antiterminator RfaH